MIVGDKNIPPSHSEFRKVSNGISRGEEELITTLSNFDLKGSFPLIRSVKHNHSRLTGSPHFPPLPPFAQCLQIVAPCLKTIPALPPV